MVEARRALVGDAEELVRLRAIMLAMLGRPGTGSDGWRRAAARMLAERLAAPHGLLAAFVVDRPDGTGLAACAVGVIERRLPGPDNPSGRVGYVFNVVTDPAWRRRGYSRACMRALLDWYSRHAVTRVDLTASPHGEPLYRELGFVPASPAMRLALPTTARRPDDRLPSGDRYPDGRPAVGPRPGVQASTER